MAVAERTFDVGITGGPGAGTHALKVRAIDQSGPQKWDSGVAVLPWEEPVRPTAVGWGLASMPARAIGPAGDYAGIMEALNDGALPGPDRRLQISPGASGRITQAVTLDDRAGTGRTVIEPTSFPFVDGVRIRANGTSTGDEASLAEVKADSGNDTFTVDHTARNFWLRGLLMQPNDVGGGVRYHVTNDRPTTLNIAERIAVTHSILRGHGPAGIGVNAQAYGVALWANDAVVADSVIDGMTSSNAGSGAIEARGGIRWLIDNCFLQADTIRLRVGFTTPLFPIHNPQQGTVRRCHLHNALAVWNSHKGAVEMKNGGYWLVEFCHAHRGIWANPGSDTSNVVPFGMKVAGLQGTPMYYSQSLTVRFCIVTHFPMLMYMQNIINSNLHGGGCDGYAHRDVLAHRMGPSADSFAISGSNTGNNKCIQINPGQSELGRYGPDRMAVWGNTVVVEPGDEMLHVITVNQKLPWHQDGAASRSYWDDNVFPESTWGAHGGTGSEPFTDPGGELEGLSIQYCVVPGANAHAWDPTVWRPGTFDRTNYLDSSFRPNATFISEMEAALGVGVGGQIASQRSYYAADGTTVKTRQVPGCDIDELIGADSPFTDVDGGGVNTPTEHIKWT